MACPICKKEKKIFSIKVRDYEYDIKYTALYTQCKTCKSFYRKYPSKINEEQNQKNPKK